MTTSNVLQKLAYEKLKKIQHNIVEGEEFSSKADYLAEFKYPFNTSHGFTIRDLLS